MIRRRFEDRLDLAILGVAIVLSVAGLATLIVLARTDRALVSVAVYGAALIVAYTNATLYHRAASAGRAAARFQALDHATIFVLVAGTYTPFCLLALKAHHGVTLLAMVWGLGAAGIAIRLLWLRRPYRWAPLVYLAQGWIGLPWGRTLVETAGSGAVILVVAGGIAYTAGIAFFLWRSFRFSNAAWHLFVVAGSVCHFAAIALYVLPFDARGA
jgi:hemolysin III